MKENIKINDIEYMPVSNNIEFNGDAKSIAQSFIGEHVIVRTYSAGVHYGILHSVSEKECILTNSRRLWRWYGANTLSDLAMKGTSNQEDCKFSCEVNYILLHQIEIIPCTEKAIQNIGDVKIWTE